MTSQQTTPLNQYLEPVITHKKLIAIVAVATIALGIGAGIGAPTSYSSTTSILVYPVDADPTAVFGTDDSKIDMPTELRIATSQAVAAGAAERLQTESIDLSTEAITDGVTASSPKESSILDISFTAATASKAQAGADAIAEAYLAFRTELAENNRGAAEAAIIERIGVLDGRLGRADAGETVTVKTELEAQQAALAGLSTLTVDATTVIDRAVRAEAPDGLSLPQLLAGAVAGGLALGVMAAYAASAVRPTVGTGLSGADQIGRPATEVDEPSAPETSGPAADEQVVAVKQAVEDYERSTANQTEPEAAASQTESEPEPATGEAEPETEFDLEAVLLACESSQDVEPETLCDVALDVEPENGTEVVEPVAVHTLQSIHTGDHERRELYTVRTSADERRALHTEDQPALTATPDMENLIERLQELGRHGPIVALTLGEEGVGTSIAVAFDLADALQSLGAKVLVVDAAIDDSMLASLLAVNSSPGLAEVLTGETTLPNAVRPVGGLRGLDALTIGAITDFTVGAIAGPAFERLLAEAKVDYDTILVIAGTAFDTATVPALAAMSDGIVVGTSQQPGEQAGADLCRQLAALPSPTLEFLSEVPLVKRAEGGVVLGTSGM